MRHCTAKGGGAPRGTALAFTAAVLLVAACAGISARAMEPLFLDQSLDLRYDLWRQSQAETTSLGEARYDFMITAPVLSYRLGSFAVTGTLDYGRATAGKHASSSAGLTNCGLHATLFPYRRFHLFLDYEHVQSPSYFGSPRVRGDTYGVEYVLRNRRLPNLDLSFRSNDNSIAGTRTAWTQWSAKGDQVTGNTSYTFALTRQEYAFTGSPGWALNSLTGTANTQLSSTWRLLTGFDVLDTPGSQDASAFGYLSGTVGPWTLTSNADLEAVNSSGERIEGIAVSQTASRTWKNLTYYGAASASFLSASSGSDAPSGTGFSIQGGGMYRLNPNWSLLGDVALQTMGQAVLRQAYQANSATNLSGDVSTFHIGIARGGNLPDLLRHALFFASDLTFDHRIREQYPPGYVPSELADQFIQHRVRQMGTLQFAADYYRSQRSGGGTLDWARVTGSLQAGSQFHMQLIGDSIRDNGFSLPGHDRREDDLTANLVYAIGPSAVTASGGYMKTVDHGLVTIPSLPQSGQPTLFAAVGFSSSFWKMNYGFLVTRWDQGDNKPLTSYSIFDSLAFRRITLRLLYDNYALQNGIRASRLSVDLLRLFDRTSFFGLRRR